MIYPVDSVIEQPGPEILPQHNYPDAYRDFVSGFLVVGRKDCLWTALSTDLLIKQVLTRSLRTSLTRGRGITEQQRLIWLLSMPACAETNLVLQESTGVQYNSGEQNKDMTKARQKRDLKDTLVILSTLTDRNRFAPDRNLRNIMTGVKADNTVNVDRIRTTGKKILSSMTGRTPGDYTFKGSEKAVTLASKSSVSIEIENVQVHPELLF